MAGSVAAYALMRQGNYSVALAFYAKGGGGLNLLKRLPDGRLKRHFALDYHPFWDKENKRSRCWLHYHRGDTNSQLAKHRPWEGW